MSLSFTVLGYELWAFEVQQQDSNEMLAEAIAELGGEITGGPSMHYERDVNPPNPSGEEPWYGESRRFGFS